VSSINTKLQIYSKVFIEDIMHTHTGTFSWQ